MPDFLTNILNFVSTEFKVIFTAVLPIIEVRGAIPVGIALGMTPIHATILAFLGSIYCYNAVELWCGKCFWLVNQTNSSRF